MKILFIGLCVTLLVLVFSQQVMGVSIGGKNEDSKSKLIELKNTPDSPEKLVSKEIQLKSSIAQNILKNMTLSDSSGTEFTDENRPTVTSAAKLHFDWELPDELEVKNGDTYVFAIPNAFAIYTPITGNLGEYGTFSVGTTGIVTMTFNQNTEESSNVRGTLDFSTYFDAQKLVGSTVKMFVFPIQESKTIVVNFIPSAGSSITKLGSTNKSYNPSEISWKVQVNGNQKFIKSPEVKDDIPTGLTLLPNTVEVYRLNVYTNGTNGLGSLADATEYTVIPQQDGSLDIQFNTPTLNAYEVRYTTKIDDLTKVKFTNTASLTTSNNPIATIASTVNINRSKHLNKLATYDSKTQKVKWTLQYNYDSKSITQENAILHDLFTNSHVLLPNSFSVKNVVVDASGNAAVGTTIPVGDYEVKETNTSSQNGFDLQFKNNLSGAYEINYETMPTKEITSNQLVMNQVSSPTNPNLVSINSTIIQGNISKRITSTNYSTKTIKWEQVVNNNNYKMSSTFLKDRFTSSGLALVSGSLKLIDTTLSNRVLVLGTDYTLSLYPDGNGFTLNLIGFYETNMVSTLKLTYDTKYDYSKLVGKTIFENTASITWSEGESFQTSNVVASLDPGNYTGNNGFKKGTYDALTKEITWIVGMNYDLYQLNQLKMQDVLPEGQKVLPNSIEIHKMKLGTGQNSYTDGGIVDPNLYTLDIQNHAVQLQFKNPTQEAYYVVFKSVSTDNMMLDKYKNTATLSDGEQLKNSLVAEVSIPNGGTYIGKKAVQNGEYIDWSVDINAGQSTIQNAKILDEPTSNQVLVESSFHLFDTTVLSNGTYTKSTELVKGTDYSLAINTDNSTGKQTFELLFLKPITKPSVLEYKTIIDANDQEKVSNKITLQGENITTENVQTTTDIVVKVSGGSGTGTGERGLIEIEKTDKSDATKKLENVTFELYDKAGKKLMRTGVTDDLGILQLGGLRYGEYLLKETKPAKGYLISSELEVGKLITVSKTAAPTKLTNALDVGTVELKKVDSLDKTKGLKGAEFSLQDLAGVELQTGLTTNDAGILTLTNVIPGTYRFIETKAPTGYQLNTTPYKFTLSEKSTSTLKLEMSNELLTGELVIQKVDTQGKAISGATKERQATFELKKSGVSIGKTITDSSGIANFTKLVPGTYSLSETSPPSGYQKDSSVHEVIVSLEDGGIVMKNNGNIIDKSHPLQVTNMLLPFELEIEKIDISNGKPLAGAQFELSLVKDGGTEVVNTGTSSNDGKIKFSDLKPGSYYEIKEAKAPIGYHLSETSYILFIGLDGQVDVKDNVTGESINVAVSSLNLIQLKLSNLSKATVAKPKEGKIIVHKLGFTGETEIPSINGNGEELAELPTGAQPIEGAEYAIVLIQEGKLGGSPSQEEAQTYYDQVKDDPTVLKKVGLTNAEGIFDSGVLPSGRYLVFESNPATGATKISAPVVVTIPMMNSTGTAWISEIHVYTKDAMTLGAAKLYKVSDEGEKLVGAVFSLYRKNTGSPDTLIKDRLLSGLDGFTDSVGNLVVGDYYFLETSAPKEYLISQNKVEFSMKKEDHAYNSDGKLLVDKVVQTRLQNYLKPTVSKTRVTEDSTDIGKTVTWKIKSTIPKNIAEYKNYVVTDILDSRLTYKGNILVKVDGTVLNPALYELVEPTDKDKKLSLTFVSATFPNKGGLKDSDSLEITYDSIVNETATPGIAIPNTAILQYNNGFVDGEIKVDLPPAVKIGGRKFIKVDENHAGLKGAEFNIYQIIKGEKVYLNQTENSNVAWVKDYKEAIVLTSPEDGKFKVVGLMFGTYYLEEIKAPKNYNLLAEDQKFIIDAESYSEKAQLMIVNTTGPIVPVTGGIGTVLFFVLGLILMSCVLLVSRKKLIDNA